MIPTKKTLNGVNRTKTSNRFGSGKKTLLFLVMFCLILSSLLTRESFAQVPMIYSWMPTYEAPSDSFNFGNTIEAGFDLNQNGQKEFVTFDQATNTLRIFEAVGDNAFEFAWTRVLEGLESKNISIVIGDLSGDGIEELIIIADRLAQDALLIWQFDTFNWSSATEVTFDPPRDTTGRINPSTECLVGDFDNDLVNELLILYTGGNDLLMSIVSIEDFTFPQLHVEFVDTGTGDLRATGVGIGDIDMNGNKEIVVICKGTKAPIRLYATDSSKKFALVNDWRMAELPPKYVSSNANVPIVDFNNDGKLEAYILTNASLSTEPLPIFVPGGLPQKALVWEVGLDTILTEAFDAKRFRQVASLEKTTLHGGIVADGDSDGKPEIFAVGRTAKAIYQIEYFPSSVSPTVSNFVEYKILQDSLPGSTAPLALSAVADLDGDGRNEFVYVRGFYVPLIPHNRPNFRNFFMMTGGAGATVMESDPKPTEPLNLSIKLFSGGSGNQMEFSWKDNSDNEENFQLHQIRSHEGSTTESLIDDTISEDLRHVVHPTPTLAGTYNFHVKACNPAGCSPESNPVDLPSTPTGESIESHSNGFCVGNRGGEGMGWSDFVLPATDQDLIYRGFLLISADENVYDGKGCDFTNLTGIALRTGTTSAGTFIDYTTESSTSNDPVMFEVFGTDLSIEQTTIRPQNSDTSWVLCCWTIDNDNSRQKVNFAIHLDADAGGSRSVHDEGGWDTTLNLLYQQSHDLGKTIGIALIDGNLEGYQINTYGTFTVAFRNTLMTEWACISEHIPAGTNDLEMTLIADLGTIHKPEKVVFVIAANENLLKLKGSVKAAKSFYNTELKNKCKIN